MNEQEQQQNNECLDMGTLVSLHDGELPADEREQALGHIATCPDCAADEPAASASSRDVYNLFSLLGPGEGEMPLTVTALIALLLLPNASALANQFLALFQVQQFQPVDVNPQNFSQALVLDITKYGDVDQQDFDTGLQPMSEAQVRQAIHFPLLLPSHLPPGVGQTVRFALNSGGRVTFVFRVGKARAFLKQNGEGAVPIPAQLNGATYTITIQPSVVVNYVKSCPQGTGIDAVNQCSGVPFYVAEISSPVVQGVGNASLKELRDFFISLPGKSSQMQTLLRDIDLNTGTVPLPIPPQVNAQHVTAHGAPGVLLTDNSVSLGAVLWQTHGIIYVVATATSNATELLDTANSLR